MPKISQLLVDQMKSLPVGALAVGYSGGLDSAVLLHALSMLPEAHRRGIRAIHINHHLHSQSDQWANHCIQICSALDIPIQVNNIQIEKNKGKGLESAARHARYAAFSKELHLSELLCLAHHRDDQNETVLLKLMRGAGPEGLAAMRNLRKFNPGYLWRPLLTVSRAEIRNYAETHALQWIDDPSNLDTHLDRNFLRVEIFPRLREHWPALDKSINHTIAWQQAANDFIQAEAEKAFESIRMDENTLNWPVWLALPTALRDPVLRLWLRSLQLPTPAHFHVQELEKQLVSAGDREVCIRWKGTELRRYRNRLYAMKPLTPLPENWTSGWTGNLLVLPSEAGSITIEFNKNINKKNESIVIGEKQEAGFYKFYVRFRQGGEMFKPAGSPHTRELRVLFQEAGIPPWQRDRIPLIYTQNDLIAIGDLWLSEKGQEIFTHAGLKLRWDKQENRVHSEQLPAGSFAAKDGAHQTS